jgi:hypothetical protein
LIMKVFGPGLHDAKDDGERMRRMPRIMQEGSQEGCKRFATVGGSVLPFGIQTQHTESSQ